MLLAGRMVLAADGMLVNLADTGANRKAFGSAGTADDSAPFPQLRVIALTARAARAARAKIGAILGSCRAGEQTLLERLVKRRPDLFSGRVVCFDRNFPGYELIVGDPPGGRARRGPRRGHAQPAAGARRRLAARRIPYELAQRPVREEGRPAPGPGHRARRRHALRGRERRNLRDLRRDHRPPGPRGRARGSGPGDVPHPLERVGNHVRRGRDHDRRRREPHAPARSCGPGPRGWSSRRPGPGSPPPS